MLPTINDLKGTSVANDIGDLVTDKAEVVSIARTAANDTVDAVSKTMDRIMDRHNGHQKRYRDSRGRYTTRQNAAANDKVDAVGKTMDRIMARHNAHDEVIPVPANDLPTPAELTMDRIMARHNGHDNAPGRMDAANENRIIHDYNPVVPQAEKKTPILLEPEENIPEILTNDEKPKKEARRKKKDLEDSDEVVPLLRSINQNTENSVDLLKLIRQDIGDITVENQKARERELEKGKGYIAGSKESLSSMDPEGKSKGKDKEKPGFLRSIMNAGTGLVATGVMGAVGAVGSYFTPQTQPDNAGGFDGSQQTAAEKAPNRHGGQAPEPAPRPDALTGNVPVGRAPKGKRAQMEQMLFNAFKKQGYTDEGAKTMVAEVNRENGLREDLIFGSHIDPGNKKRNMGMISWQGGRADRLYAFLNSKGLIRNGKIVHSQASIEAQAEFLDMEMKTKLGKGGKRARAALMDPSKSYSDIEGLVGDDVIKWRRHDPKYRASGYHNQNKGYAEISALLQQMQPKKGTQLNQQSANQNSKPKVVVVNAPSNTSNQTNITTQPSAKKQSRVPPAKAESWSDVVRDYFGF